MGRATIPFRKRRLERVVAWLAVVMAGCSAGRAPAPPVEAPRHEAPDPATPGRAHLTWYLGAVEGKEAIDDRVLSQRFTPQFLAKIPPDKFRAFTESLRAAMVRLDLVRLETTDANERVHAITRSAGGVVLHVKLEVEAAPPHQIKMLLVEPEKQAVDAPEVRSWSDAERALRALAPRASLLAAELDSGRCVPIHAMAAETSLAVGSSYKLFVLATLAERVESGSRSWGDPIASDKFPTLLAAAENMIGKSDNAAADDLVVALGRETIEKFAQDVGAADARAVPLLLTRETFGLKYATSPDERHRFAQANRDERLLLAKDVSTRKWNPPTSPSAIDRVGWFASLRGLCATTLALHQLAGRPPTAHVGRILAANPGLPDPKGVFSYLGYKGGSEPGLYNVNFLLRRSSDGKWLYFGATLNDEQHLLDEAKVAATIGAIRSFLGSAASGA